MNYWQRSTVDTIAAARSNELPIVIVNREKKNELKENKRLRELEEKQVMKRARTVAQRQWSGAGESQKCDE